MKTYKIKVLFELTLKIPIKTILFNSKFNNQKRFQIWFISLKNVFLSIPKV